MSELVRRSLLVESADELRLSVDPVIETSGDERTALKLVCGRGNV